MDAAKQSKSLSTLGKEEEPAMVMRAATDSKKLQAVIAATEAAEIKIYEEIGAREGKLKAIAVAKEDVDFIAAQFDIPANIADRTLRLHGGDFNGTVAALLGATP
jgi:NACalpha-BTF3-like transcription factor